MNKKFAFTLAEIMNVIGIIGIISAMTVPTLVYNYQKKTDALQLRKVITEITAAADMYVTEEGKTKLKHTKIYESKANANNFIRNKFKVVKECATDSTAQCFGSRYYSIDKSSSGAFNCGDVSFVLANSAAISVNGVSNSSEYMRLYVDINGQKGPNVGGRDMFMFFLSGDANIVPKISGTSPTCVSSKFGNGCYELLIQNNWIMNY